MSSSLKQGMFTHYVDLPRTHLYILVKQVQTQDMEVHRDSLGQDFSADYMIRVKNNNRKGIKDREFYLPDNGKLSFTRTDSEVKLDWGKITWSDSQGSIINTDKGITYTVIATKDDRASLDS